MKTGVTIWRPVLLAAALLLTAGCRDDQPASASGTPLLVPSPLTVVEMADCVGHGDSSYCATLELAADLTGVDWVDAMLLNELALNPADPALAAATGRKDTLEVLETQAAAWAAESRKELQEALAEEYFLSYESRGAVDYLYQRGALASFRLTHYAYSGGAHGMYASTYKLLDLDGRRWLELNDILRSGKEQALFEALLSTYHYEYSELAENWLTGTPQEVRETLLSGSFVFNDHGLVFSYPPYVLGPYAEGEIRLQLSSYELKELLRPGYPFVQD